MTRFPTYDDNIILLGQKMMQDAKKAGEFTDSERFKIVCHDCNTYLIGEKETIQHAKLTGHTNFHERS